MKRTAVIVILVILLLLSAGTNTFFYLNGNKSGEQTKNELALMKAKDSLQSELQRLEDSLNSVVKSLQSENQSLTAKVGELEGDKNPKILAAYRQISILRRQLLAGTRSSDKTSTSTSNANGGISDFGSKAGKGNLDELRRQLAEAKKKIAFLTSQIDSLTNQKNQLIADLDNERNAKKVLETENVELKERLEKGAMPQFGTLITTTFDPKGGEIYKSKKVDKFKITFDVLENPMTTSPVEEEVTIRIIDPNGGVLSSTNKTLEDKSKVYTIKQTITLVGAVQKVKWSFPGKGSLLGKLGKGRYITELWTRGLLRQKNTFELD
jgi:uncharacterized protein YoxC